MAESFEQFCMQSCEEVSSLQDEFIKLYDLNSYEHWLFDDVLGVFEFKSDDGRQLFFKYSLVGSFSANTATWKWSWDNEHLTARERKAIQSVKEYGESKGYSQLTTGLVPGDEYTGWDMTSICAKVMNAMGVYRFTQEHLTYYVVFHAELTKDQYDDSKDKIVTCASHGTARAAFVCQHLNKDTYTGFHEPFESDPLIEQEDDLQAWCDECEKKRQEEGEWNEVSEAFAKIRLVCEHCFFEMKRRNSA